jgi:uncharacterized protein
MTALLGVLAASLAGSVHCAGMCGPFVCAYAGLGGGRGAHAAYHAGRLVSYAALGVLAGSLGSQVGRLGGLLGISRAAAILAGTLMVLWGAARILQARGASLAGAGRPRPRRSPMAGLLARIAERPPSVRAGATGLLTTLLPCGWLYVFVALAGGTGSAVAGAATMTVFWAGTLPALATVGVVVQRLGARYWAKLPVLSAVVVVLIGLLTIAGRMSASDPFGSLMRHAGGSH